MDKEMERKINFLVNLRCLYSNGKKPGYVSVIDDIVTSLQRGSAFEKMFREVENMYGSSLTWDIEQKYFPEDEVIK